MLWDCKAKLIAQSYKYLINAVSQLSNYLQSI